MSAQLTPENTGILFFNDINGEYFSDSITVSHISPDIISPGSLMSYECSSGGHVISVIDLQPAINNIISTVCNNSLNFSGLVLETILDLDYRISNLEAFDQ